MSDPFRLPLVVVDTETTGLVTDPNAEIIELGMVLVDCDGIVAAEFSSLVRPTARVESPAAAEARAVHGISWDELLAAPEREDVERMARKWLAEHAIGARMTSWRMVFDWPMLVRTLPSLSGWPRAACLHQVALALFGELGNVNGRGPSIENAALVAAVVMPTQSHRALADARTAARVAVSMMEMADPAELHIALDQVALLRSELVTFIGDRTVSSSELVRWARARLCGARRVLEDLQFLLDSGVLERVSSESKMTPKPGLRQVEYRRLEAA